MELQTREREKEGKVEYFVHFQEAASARDRLQLHHEEQLDKFDELTSQLLAEELQSSGPLS